MAIFDRLDRLTSRAVDTVNAIPFTFTPMKGTPNGRPGPDPDRVALPLTVVVGGAEVPGPMPRGIFDYVSTEYGIQLGVRKSYREANDLRALQIGRDPQLSIDRKYWPSADWEPKQGDLISFPLNPDLPEFQVSSSQRDGLSRMVLMLITIGAQA
ncbi:conserved protein of unknown function [Pseudorhizobium banfieldiae]|uniref:Uncharacterized protein n=1 Tax=Pseudorhizobium banfieldiae TaxID=1125847 RepID=L0NE72_9HYPH|nr:hypothetical protein [Pseudorhizobium banfieldiae]CAD6606218.1 hypothetical protein RNT25_01814 [arsenite-oxidising bacterium NT-25]CCF19159.1 conserved protein of unknown function [Pseudorhizobium banfieldiae]